MVCTVPGDSIDADLDLGPGTDASQPRQGPILVLDSGLGGLTVVRALQALLPAENVVYFGDTARLPYGSKTGATVAAFIQQIISYLLPLNPRHIVIGCNTATALALATARAAFPEISISGVIEPGAKAAVVAAGGAKKSPVIAVLATEATIRSRAYVRAILSLRSHARVVLRSAPLLVPIVEEGRREDDPLVSLALRQYLAPLLAYKPDVLVLGCTHYPVLKGLVQRLAGPRVQVIDSADQCAHDVARRLRALGSAGGGSGSVMVLRTEDGGAVELTPARSGSLHCIVTDDPHRFQRLAPRFLGEPVEQPRWVSPDVLYRLAPSLQPLSPLRAAV